MTFAPPEVPTATYRVQLSPRLPFAAVERTVPYLADLGVSHLHLSPLLTAQPGSSHGYDVTDHQRVREELGGEEGLRSLARAVQDRRMGLVVDIVPNHMALPRDTRLNRPLWEVLREGPHSPYARWFDIDWSAQDGRVLLPVLAGPLRGELPQLQVRGDTLRYGTHVFPLREGTEILPLPRLLDAQHYRLAWWRLARTELNYRRFFTVSDLIALRVEDPGVFEETHRTILRLVREGIIQGLRVDHPDGLAQPRAYLERLHKATEGCWVVAEKILADQERLPLGWPVAGTTGYDTLRRVDAVLTDGQGAAQLERRYRDFTRLADQLGGDWPSTAHTAAHQLLNGELAAETERLARLAARICARSWALGLRDHAPWALRTALVELLVRLPVYRPYAVPGAPAREVDTRMLARAASGARAEFAVPAESEAVDVVRDLALGRLGEGREEAEFLTRFAQLSSALRAKSVEDTAFYRYTPLLSANEVGGDPSRPALSTEEFHRHATRLQRDWPLTGTLASTHDTKRSGDVRAAMAVLSQCPDRWSALLEELSPRYPAPERRLEWCAWQTAWAMGPHSGQRLTQAMVKSEREAGLRTCWSDPDEEYERDLRRFCESGPAADWPPQLARLAAELAPHLRANVLGQTLLHLLSPGVPDLYQGDELHTRALVDPDNRRPFTPRPELLRSLDEGEPPASLEAEKLRWTAQALRLRRDHREWFGARAHYEPLTARGPGAAHCLAFVRSDAVVAVTTRLSVRLAESGGWRDTHLPLPEGHWRDLASGDPVPEGAPLAALLGSCPVTLLVREDVPGA
ncbi:malto-oligosyltrehalose synthase [Streptomyces sp. NPDC005438]|uniref:malto-oligosyltrehalose synthase n=1 Tax=Streptomyces sp. NPDC005438 TaxID=3156880 RepID=UPI0033A6065C